jgi:flavodoxin I
MKALIVYDSVYGNTEQIARAIGDVLATRANVRTVRVGDAQPEDLADLSLLVVGSPTHGSMASPATRAWLKALAPNSLRGVKVAAFDTRVAVSDVTSRVAAVFVRLLGYAAQPIAGHLTKRGGTLLVPAEGFFVKDTEGPLKDGELERAAAWAQQIAERA